MPMAIFNSYCYMTGGIRKVRCVDSSPYFIVLTRFLSLPCVKLHGASPCTGVTGAPTAGLNGAAKNLSRNSCFSMIPFMFVSKYLNHDLRIEVSWDIWDGIGNDWSSMEVCRGLPVPNGSIVERTPLTVGDYRKQHTQRCMGCIGNKRRSFIII